VLILELGFSILCVAEIFVYFLLCIYQCGYPGLVNSEENKASVIICRLGIILHLLLKNNK
jgi:hypothetical protein